MSLGAAAGSSSVASPSRPGKVCGVCGDRAKSFHFGGISCDSCKAFFRRSVQNEAYRNFQCPYEGRCEITMTSRKCCQSCRFGKCLSIGMEKGWVMSEEERKRMLVTRMEKRRKGDAEEERVADPLSTQNELDPQDITEVEKLVNAFASSYKEIKQDVEMEAFAARGRSKTEMLEMFFACVQQFAHFARRLESFCCLGLGDQEVLLRSGVLELCFMRGATVFDDVNVCWPDKTRPLYRNAPTLTPDDVSRLVSPRLHSMHMRFVQSVKELRLDEPAAIIVLAVILLSPDRRGLTDEDRVASEQEKYTLLLRKYIRWRYGELGGSLYPKVLLRLPDLRELCDAHTEYHLTLDSEEAEEVVRRLTSLAPPTSPLPLENQWTLNSYLAPSSPEDDSCSSDDL